MITNYDLIEYYDLGNSLIKSVKLAYSPQIKNEFLSMMLGEFAPINPEEHLIEHIVGDYSIKELEAISQSAVIQLSEGTTTEYEVWSLVGSMKMVTLRLPISCTKIRLIESESGNFSDIDLTTGKTLVNEYYNVEKLVILTVSPTTPSNISPVIHEHASAPHSQLNRKVLTKESLNNTIRLVEVDELYNNIGRIRLGKDLSPRIHEDDQTVISYDPKDNFIIVN